MKTTPASSQGFTGDGRSAKHEKLQKSPVALENDRLAKVLDDEAHPPLHRKEDLSQGDEGVDDKAHQAG